MTENIYEPIEYNYDPYDLCECYEPVFEPPESFLKECTQYWLSEWRNRCKPFVFPDGSYVMNSDGETHYCRNGIMIKVSEHFPSEGRTVEDLIEDLVIYQSKQM